MTRCLFFFKVDATTVLYTLSLHDALPIYRAAAQRVAASQERRAGRLEQGGDGISDPPGAAGHGARGRLHQPGARLRLGDRKSTRLNSSHMSISYAVFCLKKKKRTQPAVFP